MTDCDICNILKNKDVFKFIYEDDLCFAILHESPAVSGHTLVIPKQHTPIIEELEDNVVEHLFNVCNKVSTSIFESLGALGTNLILNNGLDAGQELPHLVINVLPRKENDSLNFEWTPKQSPEPELKAVMSRIKTYSDLIFAGKDELPKVKFKEDEEVKEKKPKKEEEDYTTKSLKRMP